MTCAAAARQWLLRVAVLVLLAGCTNGQQPAPQPVGVATAGGEAQDPEYIGSAACAGCHAEIALEWKASQHAIAMQPAGETSILGAFDGRRIRVDGLHYRFFREGADYLVEEQVRDQPPSRHTVRYAFGVAPLQQYLLEGVGGRLQALTIAWDTRQAEYGGNRWFSLYPGMTLQPGDALHWSGYLQSANLMCVDCHVTGFRKNFDPTTNRYASTWAEVGVGCEACHGAGSLHGERYRQAGLQVDGHPAGDHLARLDERRDVVWTTDRLTRQPVRSRPRISDREIEVCARCHSRRSQLTDSAGSAGELEQGYRTALIEPGLFFADGQMRDEVYNYGSFVQSRMYAAGVTCSDCHNPHTGRIRAEGDALCGQCHELPRYASRDHHLHDPASAGARCVACHAPTRIYMQIDGRHDHSFRIPRPDRTLSFSAPNACDGCHARRGAKWAAARLRERFGPPKAGQQYFAEAFAAADAGDRDAVKSLPAIVADGKTSALVRASALERLANLGARPPREQTLRLAADPNPLLRRTAAVFASTYPEAWPMLLGDRVRSVRVEAVGAAIADGTSFGDLARLPGFDAALDDYLAAQRFNSDRPEGLVNLGNALLWRGDLEGAATTFAEALQIDREFVAAAVNLAEARRMQDRESDAERVLRDALPFAGGTGAVHHALALSLVRQGRVAESLPYLAEASRREPTNVRFSYVYAVALHDSGQGAKALQVLGRALRLRPGEQLLQDTLNSWKQGIESSRR